ncbi:MAG: 30S ribosomal protein S8 [Candidatus Gracilibacteria bacterium]
MTITDPIADLLTRIRNATRARKLLVHVPYSRIKEDICKVLKETGYIDNVKSIGEKTTKELLIELKEGSQELVLKTISKPGQRIYVKSQSIPKVLNGLGIAILSTPKGVMSGKDARKAKVGGELLCEIY